MKAIERAVEIVGSQDKLALAVGVTQGLVSQWINGITRIHTRHFLAIEQATGGKVTPEDLLADELAAQAERPTECRASA